LKSIIVITDLRSVPVMAALNIVRQAGKQGDAILVASERLFYNKEYADYTPFIWKLFLLSVLRIFCSLKLVRKNKKTKLLSPEKLGLTSSLYSITNDSGANINTYPKLYSSLLELTLGSKEVTGYLGSINDTDIIYVFNGRTASSYLVTKYAHNHKIRMYFYEYARHCNGYRLYPCAPHASGDIGKITLKFGKESCVSNPMRNRLSRAFRDQKINNPFSLANTKKCDKSYDVSIYLGSDHEYTAVDPDICNIEWRGNIEFIKQVIVKYGVNKSYAIRCHPNQENDKNWQVLVNDIEKYINSNNANDLSIDLYGPRSGVSSYDLMASSKVVATDLSSIAVDAVLLGYNVDVFGNIELRQFLSAMHIENIVDESGRIKYVSELLALYEVLFVIRFGVLEKTVCRMYFTIQHGFKKMKECFV